jgi:hypothetical protein
MSKRKPTVKQIKCAKLVLEGETKTDAALKVYDIDKDKPGAQQTAIQLSNTALSRYTDYVGKDLSELLDTPNYLELVDNGLPELMQDPDPKVRLKAIELWSKLVGKMVNRSASIAGNIKDLTKKWRKE